MTSIAEHIAIEQKEDGLFVCKRPPERMGNAAPIAYGGYAIAAAIHSACSAAPDDFHLYSVMGHYLRPASTDQKLFCRVTETRRSASFITYQLSVDQAQADGKMRCCAQVLADFHREEPSILTYSAKPTREYSHWSKCLSWKDKLGKEASAAATAAYNKMFGLAERLYELRPCPEGISSQNMMGYMKTFKTTQDHLSPEAKTSADWVRIHGPLSTRGEHLASLGFFMDGALSFLPLTQNHMFLDDAAACSSLDFALRIFTPDVSMTDWNLREFTSHSSAHGRTYSESRLWGEDGTIIASMSQQSILRVPKKMAKI
ncbi:hypothetical protein K4F52_008029 [Lecanicillium sp. MT-2017a]|nr:hypothetical protein K4F52_008029 [Lecanicillium sp. MT-2017a]